MDIYIYIYTYPSLSLFESSVSWRNSHRNDDSDESDEYDESD